MVPTVGLDFHTMVDSVAAAVGPYVWFHHLFYTTFISSFSSVLVYQGRLKEWDRLHGDGWLGCFKLGLDGLLDGSLGRHGGRVIEHLLGAHRIVLELVTGSLDESNSDQAASQIGSYVSADVGMD